MQKKGNKFGPADFLRDICSELFALPGENPAEYVRYTIQDLALDRESESC